MLLHRTILPVQEGTRLANEDPVVQNTIGGFVLHAINAELVKFVVQNFLIQVRNQVWVLNLRQVLWHPWYFICAIVTVRIDLGSDRLILGKANGLLLYYLRLPRLSN